MARQLAVLVNRNAHGVTARHLDELRRLAGTGLYVSDSLHESQRAARAILDAGYQALGIGGGDGTFMQVVSDLIAIAPAPEQLPVLMPLRLGTGNAIADVSGSSPATASGLARDLERAAGDEPAARLKLVEVEGRLAHFTGVGLDADFAGDLRWLTKTRALRGPVRRLARGVTGVVATAAVLTVPRLLVRAPRRVRIVALDEPARRLSEPGDGGAIAPGEVLYEGPFTIAAAGTIHSYAHGMNFFPFAEALDDAFHLRVSAMTGVETLAALPRAFDGTYRHPRLLDFAARAIAIELDAPARFHIAGDLHGPATRFTVRLSPRSAPMLFRAR
jgi:diacylglycerol kinase family enzyme